jgi:hypothetical protein
MPATLLTTEQYEVLEAILAEEHCNAEALRKAMAYQQPRQRIYHDTLMRVERRISTLNSIVQEQA